MSDSFLYRLGRAKDRLERERLKVELYEAYGHALLRFIASHTGDVQYAEDSVVEIMLSAWRNAAKFDGQNERAYFYSAARNKISDYFRRVGSRKFAIVNSEVVDQAEAEGVELQMPEEREDMNACLREALAKLPDNYREVARLTFLEGMEIKDAAKELGLKVRAVYMIRTRLLTALAENPELRRFWQHWREQ